MDDKNIHRHLKYRTPFSTAAGSPVTRALGPTLATT